jgi:hypothetical protein
VKLLFVDTSWQKSAKELFREGFLSLLIYFLLKLLCTRGEQLPSYEIPLLERKLSQLFFDQQKLLS